MKQNQVRCDHCGKWRPDYSLVHLGLDEIKHPRKWDVAICDEQCFAKHPIEYWEQWLEQRFNVEGKYA